MNSENELVNSLKIGTPGAVEKVVALHGDRLLKSAYLLCGHEGDARDLVQETFLQAMLAIKGFKGKSSLYTWLYGILLNLNRRRKRKNRGLTFPGELPDPPPSDSPDFEEQLDRQTLYSHLHGSIRSLSVPHREVVILRYFEGMKIEAIAKTIGVSKGTVKSRLFYAGKQVRKKMPEGLNLFYGKDTK